MKEKTKTADALDFLKWLRTNKFQPKGKVWIQTSDPNEKLSEQEVCDMFMKENKF